MNFENCLTIGKDMDNTKFDVFFETHCRLFAVAFYWADQCVCWVF